MISDPIAREVPPKPGGTRLPRHVGLIPDGNRRWAKASGAPKSRGWRAGADKVEELLGWCEEVGVEVVTLWLLSTDNLNRPAASLLHGDLWAGNAAATGGEPVIFDPAVYFGDRETDLAMTELFGGFPTVFYDAYREAWPLDPGYAVRRVLYNLYHVLNHVNLFGGGYLGQAERMLDRLLAEVR